MVREGRRATSLVQENEVEGVSSQEKETLQALASCTSDSAETGGRDEPKRTASGKFCQGKTCGEDRETIYRYISYMYVQNVFANRGIQPPLKSNDMKEHGRTRRRGLPHPFFKDTTQERHSRSPHDAPEWTAC